MGTICGTQNLKVSKARNLKTQVVSFCKYLFTARDPVCRTAQSQRCSSANIVEKLWAKLTSLQADRHADFFFAVFFFVLFHFLWFRWSVLLFQRHETERETSSRKHSYKFFFSFFFFVMCEGKSRLYLAFLQVVLNVLLAWFDTCGSSTLCIELFSGSEGSTETATSSRRPPPSVHAKPPTYLLPTDG